MGFLSMLPEDSAARKAAALEANAKLQQGRVDEHFETVKPGDKPTPLIAISETLSSNGLFKLIKTTMLRQRKRLETDVSPASWYDYGMCSSFHSFSRY